jgi:hypothetical protein
MLICPNKNDSRYKKMVTAFGETKANYYFTLNNYDFLSDEQIDKLKNNTLSNNSVDYNFKLLNIISNRFNEFNKLFTQYKNKKDFFKKLLDTKYNLPKEQVLLLESLYDGQSFNDLMIEFASTYNYPVEINIAKGNKNYEWSPEMVDIITGETSEQAVNEIKGKSTSFYSNLTVPGGTNYIEVEIATPLITPGIKGHAQFATDNGIGWFRSDDKLDGVSLGLTSAQLLNMPEEDIAKFTKNTKTRRILEVQSDLFQKSRNENFLLSTDIMYNPIEIKIKNQFLQLLNKDNNWVTFFVKSIIQDTINKGYEKVLFPSGNTASKVEGHTTLEEFKKEKENRIKELENEKFDKNDPFNIGDEKDFNIGIQREINQLKQELERVEKEGFGALKPIYNFYENTLTNILKKNYTVNKITDEYGNTWNEVILNEVNDVPVLLDKQSTEQSNNQSSDLKEKYFNGQNQANLKDVLNKISKSDYKLSELADNILKYLPEDTVVNLIPDSAIDVSNSQGDVINAAGIFNPNTLDISIAEFANFKHSFENTLLHEALHYITYYTVKENSNEAIAFRRLYNHALSNLNKDDYYALTDIDEFIVGLFTDAKFIKALQEVAPLNKVRNYKNLFENIFDKILSIIKVKKSDSFYNQAFSLATQIINNNLENYKRFEEYTNNTLAQPSLRKEFGLNSKHLSNQQTINVKKNVEKYNRLNNTSYFVKFTQLGQSTLYSWEIEDKANGQKRLFDEALPSTERYSDNELTSMLKEFCEKYGIDVKVIDNLKLNGMKVDGIANILSKLIELDSNSSEDVFTEEVAHFAIELLGDNNPHVRRLMRLIPSSESLKDALGESYYELYMGDRNKLLKEVLGKELAKAIKSNFNSTDNVLKSTFNAIYRNFLRVINTITSNKYYKQEIEAINKKIAYSILNNTMKGNTNNLTDDLKLASIPNNEKELLETIYNVVDNRRQKIQSKNRNILKTINSSSSVDETGMVETKRLDVIKSAIANNDPNTVLKELSKQIDKDLLGFTTDIAEANDSLINRFKLNRDNFAITAEMLDDIYIFTHNYSSALNDVISYLEDLDTIKFDKEIAKLKEQRSEIMTLQGYYEKWEKIVMRNVLTEAVEEYDVPYTVDDMLTNMYENKTTVDSSWFRLFLGSARYSSNNVIRTLANIVAKSLKVVENHKNKKGLEILEAYNKIKGNFNTDELIEDVDGELYLIQEYKLNEFKSHERKEELKFLTQYATELGRNIKDYKSVREFVNSLEDDNNGVNEKAPYFSWKINFAKENYTFADGSKLTDNFFRQKDQIIEASPDLFPLKLNSKWLNPKFNSLSEDVKNYYNLLLDIRKEDLARLPKKYNRYDYYTGINTNLYKLPQISQNFLDAWSQGKGFLDIVKDGVRIKPEDIQEYGDIRTDYFGNEIKYVPINFFQKIPNASKDLNYISIAFTEMSKNYEVMSKVSYDANLILRRFEKKRYAVGKGKKGAESNDYQTIKNLIDRNIYSIKTEKIIRQIFDKNVDVSKIVQKFNGYIRNVNLGGNFISAISNTIKAKIDIATEALVHLNVSKQTLGKAKWELKMNLPSVYLDAKSSNPQNKMHRILLHNNVFDMNTFFRNVDKNRVIRYLANDSSAMLPFEIGEYSIKAETAIALMMSNKIHNGRLVTIDKIEAHGLTLEEFNKLPNYYENFIIENGKLTTKLDVNENDIIKLQLKIDYLSNLVDGRITDVDKGKAFSNVLAQTLLVHRNWLIVGIDRRFKNKQFDYTTNKEDIGYYRASFIMMNSIIKEMIAEKTLMIKFKSAIWNNLSKEEKLGVQRTMYDLAILTGIAVIWGLLQAAADDEDDWTVNMFAYTSTRVLLEHSSFINPTEIISLLKSPSASTDGIIKIQDFLFSVFDGKQVEKGMYEGYENWEKGLIKMIPILKNVVEMRNPEYKNDYLKNNALQLFSPLDPTK